MDSASSTGGVVIGSDGALMRVAVICGLVTGLTLLADPAAEAQSTTPYTTLNVAVGSNPYGVAVDQTTDTVYVANYGSGTVSVIDGATDTVTATIMVGSAPVGLAVDGATDTVYVANAGSGAVSVIDGSTNMVTATVAVGTEPEGVAVDKSTDTVYVANNGSDTMSVIDGATNNVTATVVVGTEPAGASVDDATGIIYVANYGSDTVSVIIPASVNVSPTSSTPGTSVTVSGRGFHPGETVEVTYKTGLASPASVIICTATTRSNTSYSCSGTIPPRTAAGANGAHKIVARSQTSHIKVKTTFTLT
jgi:YVTN family beta-propeller protein